MTEVKGRTAWNKGKKMPHTPKWEAKRVAAVREAAKGKVCPTGRKHSDESKKKMSDAIKAAIARDPESFKKRSIENLPKDIRGDKNGNWRGGRTAEKRDFATRNSGKMKKWRKSVFDRDGHKCKDCGSTEKLEAHHILPLGETTEFAFDRANGVTLCKKCHKKTRSYCGKGVGKQKIKMGSVRIFTVPGHWQDYPTLGNWRTGACGSLSIMVSEMGEPSHEFLIALHELVESFLCKRAGVTQEQVDEFDMSHPDSPEPGDEPDAPYLHQHQTATKIERLVCEAAGIDWNAHLDFLTEQEKQNGG